MSIVMQLWYVIKDQKIFESQNWRRKAYEYSITSKRKINTYGNK